MAEKEKKYYEGVGRRKTATARVRIFPKKKGATEVNGKSLPEYFSNKMELVKSARSPLVLLSLEDKFKITALTRGGGTTGQADAIKHGLSRALVKFNPDFRKKLSKADYLTRDDRMKERKKPGLKGARKSPQWGKR